MGLGLVLFLASAVLGADLPSIQIKGSKFFYPNGTQFFIKGIAYQQDSSPGGATTNSSATFTDPLADEASCKRDIPLLQQLQTNVIRTYAIDPTADHSACMKLLSDAGIYVLSDLGNPQQSINRGNPEWNVDLLAHYQKVVDSLASYSNVIGFFAGNEVTNNATTTPASAYVKAAVRDVKRYIKNQNYRPMGVGYAADDDADIRDQISAYFNCGPAEDSVDFLGCNVYEWCGKQTFESSGYNRLLESFQSFSVPVFFGEYGCNLPGGAADRIFDDTAALYVSNMTAVFSGGFVYEYFEEANDYGLVKVSDGSATKLKDFAALQKQISAVSPEGVQMSDYSPSNKAADCPAVNAKWQASPQLPPTPNADACSCMAKAAECVVANSTDAKDYGSIFGFICGSNGDLCKGINANTSTGVYGAYSMCSDKDKLTYVLNQYYSSNGKASTSCSFKGSAQTQTASGSLSHCDSLAAASASGSGNSSASGNGGSNSAGTAVAALGFWSASALLLTMLASAAVSL
ncbi:uncharacterized protein UV8b_05823 [Ustilaginoidea virens]|uniref:1,3-beta-glucanosyltransferase n=1 Tax=Ustilaginoidea virens TaxID=1159556 RepID=A0A063CA75_USTVR|nr:uncharacterized protein UV8b_05823 [Ustilaginoidea virens]QUC21580.1 hypothetical protein UV8b_05823 [Ustilaginoidea virens]GAO13549.1 hypothetical protein UVI_02015780 [Ustilaginoidea virens]